MGTPRPVAAMVLPLHKAGHRRSRLSLVLFTTIAVLGSYTLLHILLSPLDPFSSSLSLGGSLPSLSPLPSPSSPSSSSSSSSLPPATYHNYTSAFSFDLDQAVHPTWMARIPDAVSLTSLSIPGTHDTLTFDLVDNEVFQCQNHNLQAQLRAGLRYFDIRGRLMYNATGTTGEQGEEITTAAAAAAKTANIGIFHAHVYTGYTFQDVLLAVFAFLEENPSEGIILRVKQEGAPVPLDGHGDPQASAEADAVAAASDNDMLEELKYKYNTTFEEAFNYYRLNNPATAPGCAKHFLYPWPPTPSSSSSSSSSTTRMVPTMGELRNKVLILYEFPTIPTTRPSPPPLTTTTATTTTTTTTSISNYGIPWTSPHISLEDLWIILTPQLLESKWDAVRENLLLAAASPDDADVLFLTHLSASVGVLPIEAAAGPFPERANGSLIVGINERTGLWLEQGAVDMGQGLGTGGKTGVVMGDFLGKRLVEGILTRNQWLEV